MSLSGDFFLWIGVFCVVVAAISGIYYWFWALISVWCKRPVISEIHCEDAFLRFALVVPAHNEASVIVKTLSEHKTIDYPKDLYDVYVIADNCTDNTAELARKCKVLCYERTDLEKNGKGFALEWAIEKILSDMKKYDAVVIVDADCFLSSNCLKLFCSHIKQGCQVMQTNFSITNADTNPITFVAALGNFLENALYYSPKSCFGAPVFLQGTGMVFAYEILKKFSWQAFSISEDFEYSIELLRKGIKIKFIDDVVVCTETPVTKKQLSVQRKRWAVGGLRLGKKNIISLLYEGIRKRNIALVDSSLSLLVVSRPILILTAFAGSISIIVGNYIKQNDILNVLFIGSLFTLFLYIAYYLFGLIRMGLSLRRAVLCLGAFYVVIKLMWISVLGAIGISSDKWERTPR